MINLIDYANKSNIYRQVKVVIFVNLTELDLKWGNPLAGVWSFRPLQSYKYWGLLNSTNKVYIGLWLFHFLYSSVTFFNILYITVLWSFFIVSEEHCTAAAQAWLTWVTRLSPWLTCELPKPSYFPLAACEPYPWPQVDSRSRPAAPSLLSFPGKVMA